MVNKKIIVILIIISTFMILGCVNNTPAKGEQIVDIRLKLIYHQEYPESVYFDIYHDEINKVTCYKSYSYGGNQGGLSCIPDSQLR